MILQLRRKTLCSAFIVFLLIRVEKWVILCCLIKAVSLKSAIFLYEALSCMYFQGRYAGDEGLIPGSRRSPEGGNHNPLQYSCLENFMDRRA